MSNKTESDQRLLEEIKIYKSSEKGKEIAASVLGRNFPSIPVFLFFEKFDE